mmetsp:Transcript_21998/g.48621  ORF Transcript_21998/g.48621 Transcript_21998/m.48621 type:complete len:206 (-) Transcript_21998:382-999(-)
MSIWTCEAATPTNDGLTLGRKDVGGALVNCRLTEPQKQHREQPEQTKQTKQLWEEQDPVSCPRAEEPGHMHRQSRPQCKMLGPDFAACLRSSHEKERNEARSKVSNFLKANGFKGDVNTPKRRLLRSIYPLHTAMEKRDAGMVSLLLYCRADVNFLRQPRQPRAATVTPQKDRASGQALEETPVKLAQKHHSHWNVARLLTAPAA